MGSNYYFKYNGDNIDAYVRIWDGIDRPDYNIFKRKLNESQIYKMTKSNWKIYISEFKHIELEKTINNIITKYSRIEKLKRINEV